MTLSNVEPPITLDGNLFDWTDNCPRHLQISSWTIVRAFKSGEFFPTSPFPDSFGGQQIDPKYQTCHRMTTFYKHLLLRNRNSSASSERPDFNLIGTDQNRLMRNPGLIRTGTKYFQKFEDLQFVSLCLPFSKTLSQKNFIFELLMVRGLSINYS